jgi:hypothetical protein
MLEKRSRQQRAAGSSDPPVFAELRKPERLGREGALRVMRRLPRRSAEWRLLVRQDDTSSAAAAPLVRSCPNLSSAFFKPRRVRSPNQRAAPENEIAQACTRSSFGLSIHDASDTRGGDTMIRLTTFVASVAVYLAATPGHASQCPSSGSSAFSRSGWAATHKRLPGPTDHESACRALAAALAESVLARHSAAACTAESGPHPDLEALDKEINAFNDLFAAECRG